MLVKITLFAALLLSIVVPFAYFLSGTKNKARYKLWLEQMQQHSSELC